MSDLTEGQNRMPLQSLAQKGNTFFKTVTVANFKEKNASQ